MMRWLNFPIRKRERESCGGKVLLVRLGWKRMLRMMMIMMMGRECKGKYLKDKFLF